MTRGHANVPILALMAMIGIFAGIGGYTFYYAKGASYLFDDPKVCMNCHIMRDQYDGWEKGPHHAVATCNDCHTPHALIPKYYTKAENGFWHSKGFTLQDFHEPIQIRPKNSRILEKNCVRCHKEFVGEITEQYHGEYADTSCVRCHSDVGHGPQQ